MPAMFVYSLVFEFPEMMAGGDARAQRVVVVKLPQPKASERVRARVNLPAGSEEDKWRLKKHSSCMRGSTGRDTPADHAMGINPNTVYSWKKRDDGTLRRRYSASRRPLMRA